MSAGASLRGGDDPRNFPGPVRWRQSGVGVISNRTNGGRIVEIRKLRFWLVPVVALVGSLVQPLAVNAQCNTTGVSMGTTGTPAYIYVAKAISNANTCTLTMFMNVFACHPGGQPPVTGITRMGTMLTASAFTTATNPSCGWVCNCGTAMNPGVTITTADGLPVELMDFGIEDGAAGGYDANAKDSGENDKEEEAP